MNYTGPKVKLSRKIGINITPKAGKVATKKPYPPGQHGNSKRRAKQSDYGKQLLEKQRLRIQYNISENHLRKAYEKATKLTGNTADLLVQILETRLDALVYRAGFAPTIYAARQYVTHGHIFINGRKMNVPSHHVDVNDVISVKEKSRKMDTIQESIRTTGTPEYLEVSKADFSAKLVYPPTREEIPVQNETSLVVEYYSR
jgi:small subunit ribosomal protein S4